MDKEYKIDPSFKTWGPFIGKHYENEPITKADIVIAGTVWGLTCFFALLAVYLGVKQTRDSRSPLRSVYVWLIWLELLVSFIMGFECFMHLLKFVKPSFAFYFTILFWWCIQVQLLLQIIINRIRVIVPDRRRSRWIMIGTATIVTLINISVFNIWIPARLQTSDRYVFINEIWDRIEKVLYLIIDGLLNWYFLRVVKANLIKNGLTKYNKLLKFNQRIIGVSLLMDVMIIAAMSIPNSFVYIQFHPLAYLVKLNIEMTMANLIKRIAISTSKRTGSVQIASEFASSANRSSTAGRSHNRRSSFIELSNSAFSKVHTSSHGHVRSQSFPHNGSNNGVLRQQHHRVGPDDFPAPVGNQVRKTEEIFVHSEPLQPDERVHFDDEKKESVIVRARDLGTGNPIGRSLDDITEGDSVKDGVSEQGIPRQDSDDEAYLVKGKGGRWKGYPE